MLTVTIFRFHKRRWFKLIPLFGLLCFFYFSFQATTKNERLFNLFYKVRNRKAPDDINDRLMETLWYTSGVSQKNLCKKVLDRDKNMDIADSFITPSWSKSNGVFNLSDDKRTYFKTYGDTLCMKYGTNASETTMKMKNLKHVKCYCLPSWYGDHCSIPESVHKSNFPKQYKPKIRLKPRRIVQAFPFNMEFEMLESRFNEIGEFVDVFMILESNYTVYGDPKPFYLLDKLKQEKYRKYSGKILHTILDFFPEGAHKNGWIEDSLLRDYIGQHGVTHQLKHFKPDDIFFLTDADELPKWETILFLKLHDNYPIPVGIHLQKYAYGYFWKDGITHIIGVMTMDFLIHVFHKHAIWVRSAPSNMRKQATYVNTYKKAGGLVLTWSFGTQSSPAGWHCSYCFSVPCIKNKLISTQNGDYPRWGDYPEKRNITYISHLVKTGTWFDNKSKMKENNPDDVFYAPPHILCNAEKYKHIYSLKSVRSHVFHGREKCQE